LADWQQRIRALPLQGLAFLRHFACRYRDDGCQTSAAALTYVTLFAVVPLLTLTFAAFSLIPSLGEAGAGIQRLLLEVLVPAGNPEVSQYLFDFSRQARSLSTAGGLVLVVTALLTLRTIERAFNHIWGAPDNRRGLAGFLRYWAVLTLGPVLIGAGLLMHTYLVAFQALVDEVDVLGISGLILEYLPWLLTWAAFTLLFAAVPNAAVPLRWALVGGLVATGLFQTAKLLFGALVTNSSYYTVYGAFAALPLFLLWIHLCWMIVLGGAELVRALETFRDQHPGERMSDLLAMLVVCGLCRSAQTTGATVRDRDVLRAGVADAQWRRLREILRREHILALTASDAYVLARHPAQLRVAQLAALAPADVLRAASQRLPARLTGIPWQARAETLLQASRDAAGSHLSLSLEELFDADEALSRPVDDRASPHA
jgi:membrane protein